MVIHVLCIKPSSVIFHINEVLTYNFEKELIQIVWKTHNWNWKGILMLTIATNPIYLTIPTIDKIKEIMWWNDWCCNAIFLSTFSDPDLVEIVNGFIYQIKRNIKKPPKTNCNKSTEVYRLTWLHVPSGTYDPTTITLTKWFSTNIFLSKVETVQHLNFCNYISVFGLK